MSFFLSCGVLFFLCTAVAKMYVDEYTEKREARIEPIWAFFPRLLTMVKW